MLVNVLVAAPLPKSFTYQWQSDDTPRFGMRVIVPWGRQHRIGLVQGIAPDQQMAENIKPVHTVLDAGESLSAKWQALIEFAAKYYHHPLGMIALEALPKALRVLNARGEEPVMVAKSREHAHKLLAETRDAGTVAKAGKSQINKLEKPVLNAEQLDAVAQLSTAQGFQPFLLYGVTGSGKTEVYLHTVEERLTRGEQVLVLLPEINLTPAAQALYKERLAPHRVVVMHSNLAELTRTKAWFEAATGAADVIIATRLGVLTPLPRLGMIVVDEEHDPSYKQQDGMRYHARDLALMLAKQREVPIVLGSATPALETWLKADQGAYKRLALKNRAVLGASLPKVELINTANFPAKEGLSEPAMQALVQNFEAGKQSIVFLNRRGYAPQMVCNACGWVANCDHCTAHMVWHKNERMLRCHHCGAGQRVPTHCPTCGNQDLTGFGRGTQRIEETLAGLLPTANILRIDADSTRNKGQMEALLQQAHSGVADVLVADSAGKPRFDFTGTLPAAWPRTTLLSEGALFPLGFGLNYHAQAGDWAMLPELDTQSLTGDSRVWFNAGTPAARWSLMLTGTSGEVETRVTTLPAELEILGQHEARLTLHEGRHHQIKRMFGRCGCEVISLHRQSIGALALPEALQLVFH